MEEFYKNWVKLHQKTNSTEDEINTEFVDEDSEPISDASQLIYETKDLKLIVEKGFHKRQKNFKLQDHLFYLKIEQKHKAEPPLLWDILDFLHAAFIHILDEIKSFYKMGNHKFLREKN